LRVRRTPFFSSEKGRVGKDESVDASNLMRSCLRAVAQFSLSTLHSCTIPISGLDQVVWRARLGDISRFEPTKSGADTQYARNPQNIHTWVGRKWVQWATNNLVAETLLTILKGSSLCRFEPSRRRASRQAEFKTDETSCSRSSCLRRRASPTPGLSSAVLHRASIPGWFVPDGFAVRSLP